jgi:predicted XRE-type DNA-binding protein
MARDAKVEIEPGSGNVFADIGLPGAGEHAVKAGLVTRIRAIVKGRRLTQAAAGRIMGLKQPDVSKMLRGEFRGYSVERLLGFLVALGHDVEIVVKPKVRGKRPARLTVTAA